ncbi:MAG: DUF11 domain-containing protein, partial [bacterium]|nr:DUF11 domain-containing protein [bacterium]
FTHCAILSGITLRALGQQATLELVTEVPPTAGIQVDVIEAIQGLDVFPDEILFGTRNQGAGCGGGTPASIWKATLDPITGQLVSLVHKQQLSAIQSIRNSLFESSDGTLFTGGGWCLYKPPYYSTDGGETWQVAVSGPVYPPNSTFSFAELNGAVYAGTGYAPSPGEVYRWLGGGGWERVLDLGVIRNIVGTLLVHNNRLFVGSSPYGQPTACSGTVPVYVSSDGISFSPTTGIPDCHTVQALMNVGTDAVALTYDATTRKLYRWIDSLLAWEEVTSLDSGFGYGPNQIAALNGALYAVGQRSGDPSPGIYQSLNLGQIWDQVATLDPPGSALAVHDGYLYVGTEHDASDIAYLYRMVGADLSLMKTESSDPVVAGANLDYAVTVSNAGPSDAQQVVVTDTLPAGVTFVSTNGCVEDPYGVPTCTLGTIPADSSTQYSIVVTVDSGTIGMITNQASVTSSTFELSPGDESTFQKTTVTSAADLAITKMDSSDPLAAGADLTWTVTVNNAGPSDAQQVVVTDTLPAGVTFVSTSACAEDPNGVPTCTLGTIPAGSSKQYAIAVTVDLDTVGLITNQASVTSDTPEANPGNESTSVETTIIGVTDLAISKTANLETFVPGAPLAYLIVVTNSGPQDALGSSVTDSFSPALTGVTWSCFVNGGGSCTASGSGDVNDTVDLLVGDTAFYTVTGIVAAGTQDSIANTATVATAPALIDFDEENNSSTVVTISINEIIFTDGFESGNTSTWSTTVGAQ